MVISVISNHQQFSLHWFSFLSNKRIASHTPLPLYCRWAFLFFLCSDPFVPASLRDKASAAPWSVLKLWMLLFVTLSLVVCLPLFHSPALALLSPFCCFLPSHDGEKGFLHLTIAALSHCMLIAQFNIFTKVSFKFCNKIYLWKPLPKGKKTASTLQRVQK